MDLNKKNKYKDWTTIFLTKVFFYAIENNLNPFKVVKDIFIKADIKVPEDFYCIKHKAYRTEHNIKNGDLLIFDRTDTELENNKIYYFGFDWDKYYIEDWGKYDAKNNTIISDLRIFELDEIEIMGKLKTIQK